MTERRLHTQLEYEQYACILTYDMELARCEMASMKNQHEILIFDYKIWWGFWSVLAMSVLVIGRLLLIQVQTDIWNTNM